MQARKGFGKLTEQERHQFSEIALSPLGVEDVRESRRVLLPQQPRDLPQLDDLWILLDSIWHSLPQPSRIHSEEETVSKDGVGQGMKLQVIHDIT
eukprot:768283-Hanusia_phi.AAC.2